MRPLFPIAALLVAVVPQLVHAWGFAGHRRLAANIHAPLPAGSCLREWIATNQSAAFQDDAADPDRWRANDTNEWPRHFLEIDWVDPIWSYPRDWAQAQAQLGTYAVRNGQVPWRVEEYYGRLLQNFQDGNGPGALLTVAHLSHYVTDAFSPLHNTKRFDPKLNIDDVVGLHARYESDMLEVKANIDGISQKMTQYFGTLGRAAPKDDTFLAVIAGNGLVQGLIDADVAAQGDLAQLYSRTQDTTARRWADSLTLLASLIGTAWVEAGSPTLTGMSGGCSKAVAQGDIVLRGFAWPVIPEQPPAGDGGTSDTPGSDGGNPLLPGGDDDRSPSSPSGCSAVPPALCLPLLVGAALWRRQHPRRRRGEG